MNTPPQTAWVARFHKRNPYASIRLFCFPYAGGSATAFARWASLLPQGIEVCPVQYPGRENRMAEPPLTDVGEMARLAAAALAPYFDMPFAFFGHSLGALVAYEMARELQRAGGARPRHLIASAHRAPQVPSRREPTWQLGDADFKRRLQELNGTPKEVFEHEELLELVLPLLRADFQLAETYTHQPGRAPLDCPVTVFGGTSDSDITEDDLNAWAEVTRGGFRLKMFEGDHFFIHTRADGLLREVSQILLGGR